MDGVSEADKLQPARRYADQAHSRLVQLGATVATAESLTGVSRPGGRTRPAAREDDQ